jgi:hypothetical protein
LNRRENGIVLLTDAQYNIVALQDDSTKVIVERVFYDTFGTLLFENTNTASIQNDPTALSFGSQRDGSFYGNPYAPYNKETLRVADGNPDSNSTTTASDGLIQARAASLPETRLASGATPSTSGMGIRTLGTTRGRIWIPGV